MNHATTRAMILPVIVGLIMERFGLDEDAALQAFYTSATGASFADDDTGLYGQSPNYIFGLFLQEQKESHTMEHIVARQEHLEAMCAITHQAKAQLKALGLDQWQKGYPSRAVWEQDLVDGTAWVAVEGGQVLGAFAYLTTPDPSYDVIDGAWLTGDSRSYASMHRVCVADGAKGKGVAVEMFRYGLSMAKAGGLPSLRIDTHPGNAPMRRALDKAGFRPCGSILLKGGCEDGDLRIAYEYVL